MQLTHEAAIRLQSDTPRELARMALEQKDEFVFSVRGDAADQEDWGGELRLCLNRNVVLHFTPRFNAEMQSIDELPQFTVMPDEDREGDDEVHLYGGTDDLDPFEGVVFWVSPLEYQSMVAELLDLASQFQEQTILPDSLYGQCAFVRLVIERVLDNAVVRAERPYDFTKRTY